MRLSKFIKILSPFIKAIGLEKLTIQKVFAPLVKFEAVTDISNSEANVVIYTLKLGEAIGPSMRVSSLSHVDMIKELVCFIVRGLVNP